MADEKILIISKIEDIIDKGGELAGKQVFDSTGQSLKVRGGQGGGLRGRWGELQVGKAYGFTMGEFKGFPFVQDFKSVENEFVKQAQKQVEDKTTSSRDRSMALSYSKDLVCYGKIKLESMFDMADTMLPYIETGIKPEVTIDKPDIIVALEKEGVKAEVVSGTPQPQKKPIGKPVDSKPLDIKNAGELLTALTLKFPTKKVNSALVCDIMEAKKIADIADFNSAYKTICKKLEEKGG